MSQDGPRSMIRILPPAIAEKIAAGEVIERPSSVVKELVENSLDAGATEIAVALEDGGRGLIGITDNGRGMDPESLVLCVKRHATSKLSSLDDLERITTLGFRGEALPSIAAVSDLKIISRPPDAAGAFEVITPHLRPQPVTFGHFLGAPHGTRVQAAGLFSQIPARLKFLKSAGAEVAQVREWLERLALAHPGTGMRLTSGGKTILELRPADERARATAVLGDGDSYPLISAAAETAGMKARFHWLQGMSGPGTRRLVQVVNGRAVRDRMLQSAMMTPFRQVLMPGHFPSVVLFLEVDPSTIDVNVHPTKAEIRFLDSGRVFKTVVSMISEALSRDSSVIVGAPAHDYRPHSGQPRPMAAQEPFLFRSYNSTVPAPPSSTGTLTADIPLPDAAWLFSPERFLGSAMGTYLMYDLGEELGLIDQHAAHERVRYEKILERAIGKEVAHESQQLLLPEAVHFLPEYKKTLEPRLGWLLRMGFEAEIFGEDSLLFRAIPAGFGMQSLRTRLKNLVDRVIENDAAAADGGADPRFDEALFERLASEACHGAIRAGDRITREEATALLEQLFRCKNPWNCPHGRPTMVRIARARLDEWFKRIQ